MYQEEYKRWLAADLEDADLKPELAKIEGNDDEIKDRFAVALKFGTAGLRGVLGAGTNRMNIYVVRQATQGLANWVKTQGGTQTVAISYDSRLKSDIFAKTAAGVLAANGIKVRIYDALMPVPALSFATRYYNCNAGIMVTASHNPAKYNGYKAYGPDGCQMTDDAAAIVYDEIQKTDVLTGAKYISFAQGVEDGLIRFVGDDCKEALYAAIEARQVRPGLCKTAGLKLVYSPLNGSGLVPVTHVLKEIGITDITVVPEQEKPDGVIVQFGGQTPLNLANALEAHGVPIIGTSPRAIDLAEDREHFSALLKELGLKQAEAGTATNVEDAAAIAARIGYPVLLRPSFVLGGRGMIIVYEEKELRRYINEAVEASEERPVLIDRFLENAVEIDVDVIADRERAVIGAIMQHVEPAGIHSGDSASMIPAMGISMKMHKEITRASKELASKLNVCGLMNIQFAVKDEQLYVIEVNPRASRTVPFVSKSIGKPLAKLAAQVMAGKTLAELGFTREITPEYYCVKEAVFPWGRFPGIDVVLGPEMKSTGEVMGIDPDPDIAFAKSQVSAFNPLPTEGKVFISVNDRDKERVLHMARQLADMGFTLCATRGTMIHLLQHDIECERAYKVNEARRPNIVDHIKNGDIDFIINTPGSHDARADDIIIRSSAIAAKTSYCTNLASAQACVNAIEALKNKNLQVCTIQEYHAQNL